MPRLLAFDDPDRALAALVYLGFPFFADASNVLAAIAGACAAGTDVPMWRSAARPGRGQEGAAHLPQRVPGVRVRPAGLRQGRLIRSEQSDSFAQTAFLTAAGGAVQVYALDTGTRSTIHAVTSHDGPTKYLVVRAVS